MYFCYLTCSVTILFYHQNNLKSKRYLNQLINIAIARNVNWFNFEKKKKQGNLPPQTKPHVTMCGYMVILAGLRQFAIKVFL